MNELITRRKDFPEKKYYISTVSSQAGPNGRWSNCLYIHFAKEDFPLIQSPPLVSCEWKTSKQRFNYDSSVLNNLEWHGGITFYEEILVIETGRTIVKVGCDYQHYMDDGWMECDNGKYILESDGEVMAKRFEQLYQELDDKP